MPISWTAALRLYGKQKGHFVVPKKGSPDYEAIKKLQNETADGPEHATKPRKSRVVKVKDEVVVMADNEPTSKARKAPTRKGGAAPETTKNFDSIVPPATAVVNDVSYVKDSKKKIVRDELNKPVKKRSGVKSSGMTKKVENFNDLTDNNLMDAGGIAANIPEQVEKIKKTPKIKVPDGVDDENKTVDSLKTNDPEAVSGRKPFSFNALRSKLLC